MEVNIWGMLYAVGLSFSSFPFFSLRKGPTSVIVWNITPLGKVLDSSLSICIVCVNLIYYIVPFNRKNPQKIKI